MSRPSLAEGTLALDAWLKSRPRPLLMGILNVTPDSFYDGGKVFDTEKAIHQGLRLVDEGADCLDIGGESTRPGADAVTLEEEVRRVVPVVEGLARRVKVPISVDTSKAAVARRALNAGAAIVNDVTALQGDPGMAQVAAQAGVPVVLMHMKGTPRTMQKDPVYDDVVREVKDALAARVDAFKAAGGDPAKTLVDPGICFGKTLEHNLALLRGLEDLKALGRPVVLGASRKSFIGRLLGRAAGVPGDDPMLPAEDRLEGSLAVACYGALKGVDILRVHDVRATRRALDVWNILDA